jgi:hypothetical protein
VIRPEPSSHQLGGPASVQPRAHRAARPESEAGAELRSEVRAGRLDGDAVNTVLKAAAATHFAMQHALVGSFEGR